RECNLRCNGRSIAPSAIPKRTGVSGTYADEHVDRGPARPCGSPCERQCRCGTDLQLGAQTRIQVAIAECSLECDESRFAGAMAGSDVVDLPRIVQARDHRADIRVVRRDQVEPAHHKMNMC